jgi:hypothetical protein
MLIGQQHLHQHARRTKPPPLARINLALMSEHEDADEPESLARAQGGWGPKAQVENGWSGQDWR